MATRVLFVDDERRVCEWAAAGLGSQGFSVVWHTASDAALEVLRTDDFDVVVADLNMPGLNGLECCERIVANRPEVPVIVITAFGSMETAIAAIRVGAYDFLSKPFEIESLIIAIERAVEHRRLRDEVKRLRLHSRLPDDLAGTSTPMQQLPSLLGRVAQSDSSVLITGENGTGKEVAARRVQERSARKLGSFVAINCAAMPEKLLEAELFGHTKGAFTDAKTAPPPERVRGYRPSHFVVGDDPSELIPLEEVERMYILRVLDNVQGNKTVAAKILGLDRATLYRKLDRYQAKR